MDNNRFHITNAALREYAELAGFEDNERGLGAALQELISHCESARQAGENRNSIIYRTGRVKVGNLPKNTRLELFVRPGVEQPPRLFLVSVRDKGSTGRGSHRAQIVERLKRKFGDKYRPLRG